VPATLFFIAGWEPTRVFRRPLVRAISSADLTARGGQLIGGINGPQVARGSSASK